MMDHRSVLKGPAHLTHANTDFKLQIIKYHQYNYANLHHAGVDLQERVFLTKTSHLHRPSPRPTTNNSTPRSGAIPQLEILPKADLLNGNLLNQSVQQQAPTY